MLSNYDIPDIKELNKYSLNSAAAIFLDCNNNEYDIVTKIEQKTGMSIKDTLKLLESNFFNSYVRFYHGELNKELNRLEYELHKIYIKC